MQPIRLGLIVSDTWYFFNEIASYLRTEFQTRTFQETTYRLPVLGTKINNWRLRYDLSQILSSVDVAFFEWSSIYLAAASHLPKRCKIITRMHHYELYHWATAINWEQVDRVIVVSSGMQRAFAENLPLYKQKTVVVPGGIRLDHFQPGDRPFRGNIGILCHLEPRKRVYELILAFHELIQFGYDLHLHIGGDELPKLGNYYRAMRLLVERLHLADRVTFDGLVRNTPEWFRNIDIFVSNSYSEGLQVAPMEAIASGCYTISHCWDGCEDMIEPQHIYVTDKEMNHLIIHYLNAAQNEQRSICARQRMIIQQTCNIEQVRVAIASEISRLALSA